MEGETKNIRKQLKYELNRYIFMEGYFVSESFLNGMLAEFLHHQQKQERKKADKRAKFPASKFTSDVSCPHKNVIRSKAKLVSEKVFAFS